MQNLAVFAFNSYKIPGRAARAVDRPRLGGRPVLILIVMVLNVAARLIYRRFGTEIR